jgi:hypothetical protein
MSSARVPVLEFLDGCPLTPEEDTLGDPDAAADDIDDLLPADLWF